VYNTTFVLLFSEVVWRTTKSARRTTVSVL